MVIENLKHRCGRRYVRKSRRRAGLRDFRCNGFGFMLPQSMLKYVDVFRVISDFRML
jgi:hypothetical protein